MMNDLSYFSTIEINHCFSIKYNSLFIILTKYSVEHFIQQLCCQMATCTCGGRRIMGCLELVSL